MRLRLGVQDLAQSVAGAREHEGQAGDVLVARDSARRTLVGVALETEQAQIFCKDRARPQLAVIDA